MLLCVIAGIAVFAWGGFWSLFWPFYIAIPLTLLTVCWITLIDQAIGAAHWRLRGILASPSGGSRMRGVIFFLRLAIGIGTSYCTATSAIMLLSHQTIVAQEARDRDAANAAKRNAAAEEKHQLWKAILGDRDAEVRLANADVTTAATQLEAARTQRDAAGQQLLNQKIEVDCQQKGGPKCDKGEGPLFRQAVARRDKAQGDLQLAETDINRFETRLTLAEHKRDDALAAFRQREPEYQAAAQAVDQRVERERVPESDDPILAYKALQKVLHSPEGAATRAYADCLLALLLLIELSYILVSEYFAHASIYDARLIARTRILAAEAAEHYRRSVGMQDMPTTSRVIPRFSEPVT